jgi:hypothetical protein
MKTTLTEHPVARSIASKLACTSLWLTPLATLAHDGHGHSGSHWHATDVWGYVAVGAAMVVALFLGGRK